MSKCFYVYLNIRPIRYLFLCNANRKHATRKRNRLNEVARYKTTCVDTNNSSFHTYLHYSFSLSFNKPFIFSHSQTILLNLTHSHSLPLVFLPPLLIYFSPHCPLHFIGLRKIIFGLLDPYPLSRTTLKVISCTCTVLL